MLITGKRYPYVVRYIRSLRGGSQPILVQASDGLPYVVKFTNNLQGANLPFNESMGNELYRACGLDVPVWRPLQVTDTFIDQNPDCWMQTKEGYLRPNSGICFGSRFLGGDGIRLLEILPGVCFKRIHKRTSFWLAWMIDICARHADNRQALFQEDIMGQLNAYFVDQGHLFGGPKGEQQPHFLASRYLDPRIYPDISSEHLLNFQKIASGIDADQLWRQIETLPQDWKTESAIRNFSECIGRLTNTKLLENILNTMVDADQRAKGVITERHKDDGTSPETILRPRVQATGVEELLTARQADCLTCV